MANIAHPVRPTTLTTIRPHAINPDPSTSGASTDRTDQVGKLTRGVRQISHCPDRLRMASDSLEGARLQGFQCQDRLPEPTLMICAEAGR